VERGTNISHWLSQSNRRGQERREWFTREDVRRIADYGFDHIRLPFDEEQLWDKAGGLDAEALGLMRSAVGWCDDANLPVILDLHILRTHHFIHKEEPALFTDPDEEGRFASLWSDVSGVVGERANALVAYELMNEPVAAHAQDWNRVARAAYRAIRER
jgi:endoglucanase